MACNNKLAGLYQVSYNGKNYDPIADSVKYNMGGEIGSDTKITSSGRAYMSTEIKAGEVEFDLPVDASFNKSDLVGVCGTITLIDDIGNIIIMRDARLTDSLSVDKGTTTVKMMGSPLEFSR